MFYRILFIIGIGFLLVGQIILAKGNEYVYNLKPIDFAHWSLLVGSVLLIPQVIRSPRKPFGFIGIPLTMIGIICMVGMCVIDFIFWSFTDEQLRHDFTQHITQVPSIWKTFMTVGPSSKVFNLGLLILSLNYWKSEKIGIGILLLATLILWHIIPTPHRLIFGYSFTLIAFTMILFGKEIKSKLLKRT
ncbi:MAG: hypothetical protein CMB99_02030 [Flavobacteriaceae bacterium]|nr:hypothetical protein [Flavobacteriaceae bacterium]